MGTADEREAIRAKVEDALAVWSEYDATGDPSVFTDADMFAEDIMHNPPDNPAIRGKSAVLDYLESFDPTVWEWDFSIVDLTIGRDLVIVELSYRGRPRPDADPDADELVGTSIDAYRRMEDGSLKQVITSPNPDGTYPVQ